MSTERRNSAVSFATSRKSILGEKTFVKILHAGLFIQFILDNLNS
jgi:hypothetical protein